MKSEKRIEINSKKKIQHSQIVIGYLIVYDVLAVSFAYFAALWLRFDLRMTLIIGGIYMNSWMKFAPFYAVICVAVFWMFRLYKSIWRFASYMELQRITEATVITTILHTVLITLFVRRMPISYYIMGPVIQFVLITGIRFAYRFLLLIRGKNKDEDRIPIMIFGAGSASTLTIREIKRNRGLKEEIACIIDDNPNKWNRDIEGIPIIGGRDKIPYAVEKYGIKKIYIAVPSISSKERKKIIDICKDKVPV